MDHVLRLAQEIYVGFVNVDSNYMRPRHRREQVILSSNT